MKTREQVLEAVRAARINAEHMPWGFPCIDGRDVMRLKSWFPVSDWGAFGIELSEGAEAPEPNPWTRESVVEQLQRDVAFGFEKALDRRGISSELMWTVVNMWLWVLDHPLSQKAPDYPMYGLPLFKAVALDFGFENAIGSDAGTEEKYGEDASVRPDEQNSQYLGDAVYAAFDGYYIWLRTGSHRDSEATNRIALEPSVFNALVAYQGKLTKKAEAG